MQKLNRNFTPSYIPLFESGELERRAILLENSLSSCTLCAFRCEIDRNLGRGRCRSGTLPIVSSYCVHRGEEPVLSSGGGVGNIFFGNCSLACDFCQNHEISQNPVIEARHRMTHDQLAHIFLKLQEQGCDALGLVTPTHFVSAILRALSIAIEKGFYLPLVYNTHAYDSLQTIQQLNGIIDIYLPDFKYGRDAAALTYSGAKHYVDTASASVAEMYRQLGPGLVVNESGVLRRGLIVRHMVLPNDIADSEDVLAFIAGLDPEIHVSLMSQYFPANRALQLELLDRPLREREYERVVELLDRFGLENGWIQEYESRDFYRPDFSNRLNPFE